MEVKAKLSHLHIAPRKVRLVVDVIRGKKTSEALTKLSFLPKRASLPVAKLLKQAIANAKNNLQLDENNLYIKKITVDEGPKLKRWRPRARGMAYPIQKKTSHINLILEEIEKKKGKVTKPKKKVSPEPQKALESEKIQKTKAEKPPKLKPELEIKKPKTEQGIKRIFRRKAF